MILKNIYIYSLIYSIIQTCEVTDTDGNKYDLAFLN